MTKIIAIEWTESVLLSKALALSCWQGVSVLDYRFTRGVIGTPITCHTKPVAPCNETIGYSLVNDAVPNKLILEYSDIYMPSCPVSTYVAVLLFFQVACINNTFTRWINVLTAGINRCPLQVYTCITYDLDVQTYTDYGKVLELLPVNSVYNICDDAPCNCLCNCFQY